MNPRIDIVNLAVISADGPIVKGLNLAIDEGETVTILGETGSGKSILARAILGALPPELDYDGQVWVDGIPTLQSQQTTQRELWSHTMTMLPQEPWYALNPLTTIKQQVAEVWRFVMGDQKAQADKRALDSLNSVELREASQKWPHELSGGMAQRAVFVMATAGGADIFLADEPTKGLDASRRTTIIDLLRQQASTGCLLTITHDVEVAAALGGRILVMKNGQVVESGDADTLLSSPSHAYTQSLIDALPEKWQPQSVQPPAQSPFLTVKSLACQRGPNPVFSDVSFTINQGEIVGLQGDSGCGNTSLGDMLLGLLPVKSGTVEFLQPMTKLDKLKLYQDPPSAFAKGVSLGVLLEELVALHGLDHKRIKPIMSQLNLSENLLRRTSEQVSGGELQRFALLRILMMQPKFIVADEPTSRLDPITAKQVIQLLVSTCRQAGCTLLLISHDFTLLEKVSDRILQFDELTAS